MWPISRHYRKHLTSDGLCSATPPALSWIVLEIKRLASHTPPARSGTKAARFQEESDSLARHGRKLSHPYLEIVRKNYFSHLSICYN